MPLLAMEKNTRSSIMCSDHRSSAFPYEEVVHSAHSPKMEATTPHQLIERTEGRTFKVLYPRGQTFRTFGNTFNMEFTPPATVKIKRTSSSKYPGQHQIF